MKSPARRVTLIVLLCIAAVGAVCFSRWDPEAHVVFAAVETESVPSDGDAADDPAIWVNRSDPARSLVLGTDKDSGLGVYDLDGRQLHFYKLGDINNVDLRDDFPLGDRSVVLVAAGEADDGYVLLFELDPDTAELRELPGSRFYSRVEPEGVALYRSPRTGAMHLFLTGDDSETNEEGWVDQWTLTGVDGKVQASLARHFRAGTTTCEGMVADDVAAFLYVSEEEAGLWRFPAEPEGGEPIQVCRAGVTQLLRSDAEGLCIFDDGAGTRLLIASSQGSDDFAVLRLDGEVPSFVGRFEVGSGDATDGVTHTDGIEVTAAPLGPRFPQGLFVCQDDKEDGGRNQNFKLVSWAEVARVLDLSPRAAAPLASPR